MDKILRLLKLSEPNDLSGNKWLFWAGLLFFTAVQASFSLYISTERHLPYGTDDAYAYIVKAPQMAEGCFLQKCPALVDLKSQFSEHQTDTDKEWLRYRASGRLFLVYHPLHSLVMWGLHESGLSWEAAYNLILIGGSVFLAVGIGFFLFQIWGATATGLALLLLSATQFLGQGLHLIVPSNLALGFGFFCWGSILKWRERAWLPVALLTILTLALHPVGKLYACVSLALLFMVDRRKLSCRGALSYFAISIPVIIAVALPHFINNPQLAFELEPETKAQFWQSFLRGARHALRIILFWDDRNHHTYGLTSLGVLSLGLYGLWQLPPIRRKQATLVGLIFVGLAALSLGVVLPRYPAEVFQRIWCLFAVFWLGGVGFASARLATKACNALQNQEGFKNIKIVLGIIITSGWVFYLWTGYDAIITRAKTLRAYDNRDYRESQVDLARNKCGTLYYASEVALVYYITHGASNCSAVYLPAIDDPKTKLLSYKSKADPALFVADKPSDNFIILDGLKEATIHNHGPVIYQQAQLLVKPTKAGDVLVFRNKNQRVNIPLEKNEPVWIDVPIKNFGQDQQIWVGVKEASGPVLLQGIRFDKTSPHSWPWGHKVSLTYTHFMNYSSHIDAESLSTGLFKTMKVLDETGSSLLAVGSFFDTP
jgi:hypothetical protein